jgi:NAD(P)-dependent dehydrogenase (short-subunit alcohol dehydrogenase family)
MSLESPSQSVAPGGNPFSVENKTVLITGGLGQLGVTYATAFAEQGARVVTLDIRELSEEKDAKLWTLKSEGCLLDFVVDITNRSALEDVLLAVKDQWGTPEVLINNAALDSPPGAPEEEVGPFESYPDASFEQVMNVNVKGSFLCCQVFGGAMAKRGKGSIVNISSIYGILSPCQDIYDFRRKDGGVFYKPVAYSVSKSAVLNLTRYLATYWAKSGVRVNTLTLAGVFNHQPEEFLEGYCARVPMGRMADAEDYVGPVLYLASEASRYMTGSNMVVDGGWSAW